MALKEIVNITSGDAPPLRVKRKTLLLFLVRLFQNDDQGQDLLEAQTHLQSSPSKRLQLTSQ